MTSINELLQGVFYGEEFWFILIRMGICIAAMLLMLGILRGLKYRTNHPDHIYLRYIYKILKAVIWVIGITSALAQIPVFESLIATLLASSGILALGVTLAAQESLGNLVNGFMISIFKPFEVGDRIHLINGKVTGKVEDITMRHTVLRSSTNSRIIVPNSTINKDLIENSHFQDEKSLGYIDACITYDSDLELACSIVANAVTGDPDYIDTNDPKPVILVRALGPFGIDLRANMWTNDIDSNFIACSNARARIRKEFEKNGIHFATNSSSGPSST
jgi:Small-conductance mechanosensitive channel